MKPLLVALLACTVMFAGCATTTSKTRTDDEAFRDLGLLTTAETGIVRGVIFDQAIRPVENATIELRGDGATVTKTARPDGLFGFDGLAPGTYFLAAYKVGYQETQASVDVVAGVKEPTPVKIQMTLDAALLPYPAQYIMDGFMTCSARIALTAVPAGPCQATDVSQIAYKLDKQPDWISTEMMWKSTQALGDAMSIVSECFTSDQEPPETDPCPNGSLVVNRSEGSSPLIFKVNATLAEKFVIGTHHDYRLRVFSAGRADTDLIDEDAHNARLNQTTGGAVPCVAWPAINQGCFRFTGVGVILNQAFKVYTTVFYGYTPPEDWLFTKSGEVPKPQ